MNYGLYLSASGVLTNLYRQDVFSNNLANVETAGFKRDLASVLQRQPEAVEDGLGSSVQHRLLDRLGGGVLAGPQRISFAPGPMTRTDGPLDVALEAPDTFFAVQQRDPQSGQPQVRLTRDGRFSRDAQGYLVTVAGGQQVLDVENRPIRVSGDAPVQIDNAGRLIQAGQAVSQLQVTAVRDPQQLIKQGQNLFGFRDGVDVRTPADLATVRPGFIESSSVDPIKTMMQIVEATKTATANANMIRYHDLLMDRAVNVLGSVA